MDTVRPSAISLSWNAYDEPKIHAATCSSVTGDRSLTFSYRNLGNFRDFYSRNSKPHKKSTQEGHTVGPSFNRLKA